MTQVAEIVTFKLVAGVSDTDYMKISDAIGVFARNMPGFVSRRVAKGEDGRWTDYVIWTDMESVEKMEVAFKDQPFTPDLMKAIDQTTLDMRRDSVLDG